MAVREPGAVTADVEYKKTQKYMHLTSSHFFVPIAVETLGVFEIEACHFYKEIAHRMEIATDDHFTHQHLVQRISAKEGMLWLFLGPWE